MSNNDWTSKLREQMADYQEPVSKDLWAGIAQSLHAQSAKKARIVKIRRWSAAAAAVALLGVGGSYVYLHQDSKDHQDVATADTPALATSADALASSAGIPVAASPAPTSPAPTSSKKELLALNQAPECVNQAPECAALGSSVSLDQIQSQEQSTSDSQMGAMKQAKMGAKMQAKMGVENPSQADNERQTQTFLEKKVQRSSAQLMNDHAVYDQAFMEKEKSKSLDWDVQLYAENGFVTTDNSSGKGPLMMDSFEGSAIGDGHLVFSSSPYLSVLKLANKPQAKHHAPISVGAQVGVRVSERLSVNTGVVYTRTSSEFSSYEGGEYDKKQVLHYVGVPLSVNYQVWGFKQLHTYVMAGGEVDFNVKNDTELSGIKLEDGVKKDRAQFSGKASVGVQYDILNQVGLYVEPGVKYYFDNGSDIDNTFKDKKWNFNFQFGLRVNLK